MRRKMTARRIREFLGGHSLKWLPRSLVGTHGGKRYTPHIAAPGLVSRTLYSRSLPKRWRGIGRISWVRTINAGCRAAIRPPWRPGDAIAGQYRHGAS